MTMIHIPKHFKSPCSLDVSPNTNALSAHACAHVIIYLRHARTSLRNMTHPLKLGRSGGQATNTPDYLEPRPSPYYYNNNYAGVNEGQPGVKHHVRVDVGNWVDAGPRAGLVSMYACISYHCLAVAYNIILSYTLHYACVRVSSSDV